MTKNPFGKTRDVSEPYAIFKHPFAGWEWRVLKTYKLPKNETGAYDRWFVAAKSPNTFGSWEYGDTYKTEVLQNALLYAATPEWIEAFDDPRMGGDKIPAGFEILKGKVKA